LQVVKVRAQQIRLEGPNASWLPVSGVRVLALRTYPSRYEHCGHPRLGSSVVSFGIQSEAQCLKEFRPAKTPAIR
jgi:hypothetical protein